MTVAMRGNPPGAGEASTDGQPAGDGAPGPNQTPPAQPQDQQAAGSGEGVPEENNELQEGEEPAFPHDELSRLDDMINKPRWVVPVLPKGELEVLLEASTDMCRRNLDGRSEACQRFFRDGLTISFTKILTDEAVSGWKFEIQRCIMKNTERLVELCVAKLADDWFPLLDLLAIALNPLCKFHVYNGTRTADSVPSGAQMNNNDLYARPPDSRTPKGWLVDLVNRFGSLKGFEILANRFESDRSLSVSVIHAYLKPWGQCFEILTPNTIQKYFMVIVDRVISFLDLLSDEELKKESKNEAKNDALSSIIKSLKNLVGRVPDTEEKIKTLEMFRLKMILRLLQISSFNGKMNALNEINKVIANVSYYTHTHRTVEEEEWLTAERVAEWIQENKVLSIVLRDSLHQPQYVEKLEKILRFVIKEKTLTLEDLDNIWAAQVGKHEAIVKNVHDLLAKLAWDFSPEQLDHLFICFQESWANATTKQREKLLELIRRLAEDDKDGVMAHKVLGLLWNLAHQEDVPTDIMDQALNAHIKILDYSCSQDRDAQKIRWIDRFVDELKNDKWVLPALKQIKEICCLFGEAPQNHSHSQRSPHMQYRHDIISMLQTKHSLVTIVAENLSQYMNSARHMATGNPGLDPHSLPPGDRYSHVQQVQERLHFLRFLLKDGQLWLCAPQAKQIWTCLAENSVYVTDREACFKWFSKLMGEDPDLDPEINKEFFESNILRLDPGLLTENGIKCFDRFFKAVNTKEGKLTPKRRAYLIEDLELIGQQYLWRVVLFGSDEVANKAIELLKETYTNLGPKLQSSQVDIHEDFIQSCMDRLRAMFDTVQVLKKDTEEKKIQQETMRMTRVLTVLREYINEYDQDHSEERAILPMSRAHRGKHVTLMVRFPNQGRQVEDLDIWSHTNESIASVRRQILLRIKANVATTKVDLYVNGELLDPVEDRRLVGQLALRDKTLVTAKLCQIGSNMPSSPDSSSDSSVGSPHQGFDGPNIETENCLPGVILSTKRQAVQFFFQLADLGCSLKVPLLRDGARALLKIIPADTNTVDKLRALCLDHAKLGPQSLSPSLDSLFFGSSQSEVLYHLEVVYSLLMPAQVPHGEDAYEFQFNFLKSGGVGCVLNMLTKNNFLPNADTETRRTSLLMVLKVGKLMLTTLGYAKITAVAESLQQDMTGQSSTQTTPAAHNQALVLQQALQGIPNPNSECVLRNVAIRLGRHVADEASSHMPDLSVVKAIKKVAWSAGCGCLHLLHASNEDIHKAYEKGVVKLPELEDVSLTKESLEVLTICLALCPPALEALNKDKSWQHFIIDLLLLSKSRTVRLSATEQFNLIATKCSSAHVPLHFFITLCFTVLQSTVKENPRSCNEYFQLLCRLLNYACTTNVTLNAAETCLTNEIDWLKKVRDELLKNGELTVEGSLLEGHLGICKELLTFMSSEKKHQIGSKKDDCNLIQELIDDFLFPASKIVVQTRKANDDFPLCPVIPVCNSPPTTIAAFDLLVALCVGCIPNLKMVCDMLTNTYYSGTELPLCEWEYLPPVGPRPIRGFVGLKNAGATCYMNSVLQQIFMVPEIRKTILGAEGAAVDVEDDGSGDEKQDSEVNVDCKHDGGGDEKTVSSKECERKEYNMGVLKQVQYVFGHLAESKLQYYVPRGFWKIYKLWGEPVNLREQHDALEFFNSLVDSLDEALKSLAQPPIFTKVMGGSFADQKICKDCPHRYSREESFTALNVDIRNQQNLLDSLEQYVKGDLLEGPNAYHCEKCNKKVDTVKRLCIKKLPNILAIQLKRFDYDWERECAIKFNDYFEFPREFDMEPYTAAGLAKIEGEEIHDDREESSDESQESSRSTFYRLVGVVVHSGQASGGHYYSYIVNRHGDDPAKWYKFDDGEVSECRMDDDDEMRNQCFGGDYMGEVFDHMLKRTSYRRQKRWWNAYILFYERVDVKESIEKELSKGMDDLRIATREPVNMPAIIQRCVRRQNIHFMHNRMQFSHEYFQFIRRLVTCNSPYFQALQGQERPTQDYEELAMLSIQLISKFLFTVGFHTKKTLRGSANEWYEALCLLMRTSKAVRTWFAQHVLFAYPARFSEYLLESPSTEVRNAFAKLLVILSHFSQQDGPFALPGAITTGEAHEKPKSLSDHLLHAILCLLNKEVSEHGRHLTQYFHLFQMYANLGQAERTQLLELSVPSTFMLVALDEGPGPPIKYQYAELGKLYSVVSQLVRCCDVSTKQQSSLPGGQPLPNPHGESSLQRPIMSIQPQVADLLFGRGGYVKKLIEDCNSSEETTKLLRFCSWENPQFSSLVLSELLWQVAYSYTYELRPYLDLLLQMLLLEDTWQTHRILNALKGIPDDRDGLFDTIQRSKNHYQKRAYQCIKCMVALFSNCAAAQTLLNSNGDLKRKWNWAVEWLGDELERRPYAGNPQYAYNNWSPPAQSNETSNGYFLERSHSARVTLAKAYELCPDEEQEEVEVGEDQESSPTEEPASGHYQHHLHTVQPQNNQQLISTQNNQIHQQVPNNQQPYNQQHHMTNIHRHNNTINNSLNNQSRPQGSSGEEQKEEEETTPGQSSNKQS